MRSSSLVGLLAVAIAVFSDHAGGSVQLAQVAPMPTVSNRPDKQSLKREALREARVRPSTPQPACISAIYAQLSLRREALRAALGSGQAFEDTYQVEKSALLSPEAVRKCVH